jgi:hypothetical protein
VVLELNRLEGERAHQLEVVIMSEDGERVAGLMGGFQSAGNLDLQPGENIVAPLAFDLRNVQVNAPGVYSVEVMIDGRSDRSLPFRVLNQPWQGLQVPGGVQPPPPEL